MFSANCGRLLFVCVIISWVSNAQHIDQDEMDGQSSRKILGSSVVTSVSVVMETGNGKHTYYSDAVGHPLSKPHIASQVASPINLLNPDRYEFYTFNDDGELVKRLMTLEEIQGIIAGGDSESFNYNTEQHAQMHHTENAVSGIVENVQNVLKEEMQAHKNPLVEQPIIDTPDISATWNMILPAFFGDTATIMEMLPDENNHLDYFNHLDQSTEHLKISSRHPEETNEMILPSDNNNSTILNKTEELKNEFNLPSTIPDVIKVENLKPISIMTTEKTTPSSTTNKIQITSELPVQTKVSEDDKFEEVLTIDANKHDSSTEQNLRNITEITTNINNSKTTERGNVTYNIPNTTENVNVTDEIIEEFSTPSPSELLQTIDHPKITELVSMVTRPTTKTSEKTTASGVTLTPSTQFTHSTQISKLSTTLKPVSIEQTKTESTPSITTDINKDNFVILSYNNTNKLAQNLNKTTQPLKNESVSQLNVTKYNITANVEQIINNVTKEVFEEIENIPIENFNVTENIQQIVDSLSSLNMNKTVTLASSLLDSHISSTTIENIPLSTTTQNPVTLDVEKSTTSQIMQNSTPLTTTLQKIQTWTNTPDLSLKENITVTPITPAIKTSTVQITSEKPVVSVKQPTTIKVENTNNLTMSTRTEPTVEQTADLIQTNSTTSSVMTSETTEITISDTSKITNPTTLNLTLTNRPTTTEKITTPLVTTSTTTNQIYNNNNNTVTSTETLVSTADLIKINNVSTTITNPEIVLTTISQSTLITSQMPSITTIQTEQPISTTTEIITSTDISTINDINTLEPYRKTEDFLPPINISISTDSWKLVDTFDTQNSSTDIVKNSTTTLTTHMPTYKPIVEYQSTTKIDLTSQSNFEMVAPSEDMFMFSKMYNELALKFWSALAVKDINFERSAVASPFGIISILAMIFLGARGSTSGEMNDVLKLDDIVTFNPHLVFKEVTESLLNRKSTSVIVRELYSDSNKGKIHDFYRERVRQFYDGHVEEVDFKKIHNVIRRRTNALISKQTKGQLPQYLEETTLSLRAPLSALSTNIYQADCSQASTEGRDGELYFIVLPSIRQRRLVPIPAAVWRSGFIAGYDPELDATAVSLGTLSQAISTIFVMPGQQGHSAPGDVLLRLEARLLNTTYIPETWTQLLKSMLPRPGLEIQLPRFLHKSVINTTEALKRMGLNEMFHKNKANLRGLTSTSRDLFFSDIMQVNEFSVCAETQQMHTEIYPSMTEHLENHNEHMRNFKYFDYFEQNEYDKYLSIPLPLRPRQARLPDIPRLRFDRPFLYFVRHNPTGLILHMGRFNPRLLT